jgi:hypothetical protein
MSIDVAEFANPDPFRTTYPPLAISRANSVCATPELLETWTLENEIVGSTPPVIRAPFPVNEVALAFPLITRFRHVALPLVERFARLKAFDEYGCLESNCVWIPDVVPERYDISVALTDELAIFPRLFVCNAIDGARFVVNAVEIAPVPSPVKFPPSP